MAEMPMPQAGDVVRWLQNGTRIQNPSEAAFRRQVELLRNVDRAKARVNAAIVGYARSLKRRRDDGQ